MAFTDPRTWTTSELVTAAIMNTYIRDNQNALNAGKEEVWIPPGAWQSPATSGAAAGTAEPTADKPSLAYFAFDKDADEYLEISLKMPQKWALGTVSFIDHWTASSSSGTTGVAFALQGVVRSDGEASDGAAFGTPIVVQDDRVDGAYNFYQAAESAAVTIDGTPADGDRVSLRKLRDISDGNDDMGEDALFLGMALFYTTDQAFN